MHDDRRIQFVFGTLVLAVVWILAASYLGWGWPTAAGIVGLVLAAELAYAFKTRDPVMIRLIVICLVAGFIELALDWWLIEETGTLVYEPGGPFVVTSPLYMPFGWAATLIQLGAIGDWLTRQQGLLRATILTGLLGAVNIPFYEHCARGAGWWFYRDTPMFGYAPSYIILGDLVVAIALPYLVMKARRVPVSHGLFLGMLLGLWICVGIGLSYALVG